MTKSSPKARLIRLPMILLVALLAACSAAQPAPAGSGNNPPAYPAAQDQPTPAPVNLTLENKLAIGTLKLEGTSQAVSAQEAKDLLPIWQQVQALSANSAATPAASDYQALYTKVESAMTADQIQAIQNMSLTAADMRSEMQALGVQGGGANAGGFQGMSADQRATRIAQMQTQNPGASFGGNGTPGARPRLQGTPNPQRTPGQGGFGQGGFGGRNMDLLFVNPLIKLLQTRSAG
jgi:hypothetical protein